MPSTLCRHLSAIEGAINRQLLTPAAARTMYAEFSLEGLLRGASTERAAFYSSGISDGWMLKSEARKLENLPAIEGLDDEKRVGTQYPPRRRCRTRASNRRPWRDTFAHVLS